MNRELTIFDFPTGARVNIHDLETETWSKDKNGKPLGITYRNYIPMVTVTTTRIVKWMHGGWFRYCVDASAEIAPGDYTVWIGDQRPLNHSKETHEKETNKAQHSRPVDARRSRTIVEHSQSPLSDRVAQLCDHAAHAVGGLALRRSPELENSKCGSDIGQDQNLRQRSKRPNLVARCGHAVVDAIVARAARVQRRFK